MSKIAVLGPEYSYSHLLFLKIFKEGELVLSNRIEEVFKQVVEKKVEKGIIPLENMLQGSVRESILGLLKYRVKINKVYTLPIHHCIAGKSEKYSKIASHQQALLQCSKFITDKETLDCSSTSKAMEIATQDVAVAALGSKEAALFYGLQILQENIEDHPLNSTRFAVISLRETAVEKNARTSILLMPQKDRPGLLFSILAPFASQNINLLKIESLPSGKKMGEYVFYLEIEGNQDHQPIRSALSSLNKSVEVCLLGSYLEVTL